MKTFAALSLVIALFGCATNSTKDPQFEQAFKEQFEQDLKEFTSADVTQSRNTLLIGDMFPNGRTASVSVPQARRLQSILSHAVAAPENFPAAGILFSPASNLCVLEISGHRWYFMPPGRPVRFRLPPLQQIQFEKIMIEEFGLK